MRGQGRKQMLTCCGGMERSKELRSLIFGSEETDPTSALSLDFLLREINVFILAIFRGVFLLLAAKNA